MLGYVPFFCRLLIFFSKSTFAKNISGTNSLDPGEARHFVGPTLDPNCLHWLSVDDTSKQIVNAAKT